MALSSSFLGTSMGVMICHAGAASAPAAPSRNVVASSADGVSQWAETRTANATPTASDRDLRDDQQPSRINDVGQRAGRNGQKEHWRHRRDLDRGHHQRVRVEAGHQPARRRVEHRDADARDRARDQDDGKGRVAEHAPARGRDRGRGRGRGAAQGRGRILTSSFIPAPDCEDAQRCRRRFTAEFLPTGRIAANFAHLGLFLETSP